MTEHPPGETVAAREAVPTRAQLSARRQFKRAQKRARNPFYLPLRWLLAMLFIVLLAIMAALALMMRLRESAPLPAAAPIEIVTAGDTLDNRELISTPQPGTAATSANEVIIARTTPASIALTGPAVATVIVTNTPVPLALGMQVAVFNVGADELNVRNQPSVFGSQVLFRAPAGTRFDIIDGPRQADGYTWWQLHDPAFQVSGWAVARYLQALPES